MSKKELHAPANTKLRRFPKEKNKDDMHKKAKNSSDTSTTNIKPSISEERKKLTIYQEL